MLGKTLKFAGSTLGAAGAVLGPLDAGFNVASLMNRDQQGRDEARALAAQYANSGLNYDQIMDMVQNDARLESAIGDIGASDYGKTLAGIGAQAGDLLGGPLALVTAPVGMLYQYDLQRKKHRRSEAFRNELNRLQGRN